MSSIINKFDIRVLGAGVLRLVFNPTLIPKYKPFLFPVRSLICNNDDSDKPSALRLIVKTLEESFSNKKTDFSIAYFDGLWVKALKDLPLEQQKKFHNFYEELKSDKARINDDHVFGLFLDYLKLLQIAQLSSTVLKPYSEGRPDEAVAAINESIANINKIKLAETYEFDPKTILHKLKNSNTLISQASLNLGGAMFDQRLGGFKPKTLNLFVGLTNTGKSQMAYHLLKRCIKHKFHAHITIVEDTEETFIERIVACLTELEIKVIRNPLIWSAEIESKILKAQQDITEYITVDFIYGESIDVVHQRKAECDAIRISNNLPPIKVDIVDYTGHIAGKSWGDKKFDKMLTAYTARKDFALKYNKIAFDFAQINREGSKKTSSEKGVLSISELAGSFDISHVCDTIISLNRNEQDEQHNQSRLHICKARNGEKGGTFTYHVDFSRALYKIDEENQYPESADLGRGKRAVAETMISETREQAERRFNAES
ncbi:MAG: DnaB-like helicase C-terminal domain-containing protein [Thermoplasmatales archaeon]